MSYTISMRFRAYKIVPKGGCQKVFYKKPINLWLDYYAVSWDYWNGERLRIDTRKHMWFFKDTWWGLLKGHIYLLGLKQKYGRGIYY